ncbi:AAA family ATPase [Solirubrobacter ginsenosidimutans]|uniref:AAA family ATPase n=1 Tax=Solirubrobacter ginsenosidimutans TaxID=490573 RepID=A0A9X3MXN7_9ACTN|nr:helix-turn-helix transcriptional regulator [Solirubrobacter ginsenosidimutans]MDA0164442.1 AAA family ATPase [Solirubrobacter ginsenosidimutans]
MLIGRSREREALGGVLDAVRAGRSATLVLRGEPGVGKTALLDDLLARADGMRMLRATGVQSEMELAFAGLHQVCAPLLTHLDRLPEAQRRPLEIAFGLSTGSAPDRFVIGLGVLGLLVEAAEEQPLLLVVDDAQWLDRGSADALTFVARRLLAESVALVFATRSSAELLHGLPELVLEGLINGDARALLQQALPGPLDRAVLDRIVVETRGNPLALLELPRGLTPAELAGGFSAPDAIRLSRRIEESFLRRLQPLPDETRRLLVIAAAEPLGDPSLVRRAAERVGIDPDAMRPAADADLVELGSRLRFRHPLVRSAIYRAATLQERLAAHAALAAETDAERDPDRRAWHRAQASPGPDEAVAAELERSAGRAQARGGLAAGAAFLERAARLTPGPGRRARRAIEAAAAYTQAGAFDRAEDLVAIAHTGSLNQTQLAKLDTLLAQVAFAANRGADGARLLFAAAERLVAVDPELARQTYLAALSAAMFTGRLASDVSGVEIANALLAAPAPSGDSHAGELLANGLALLFTAGYASALPVLSRAVHGFRDEAALPAEQLHLLWLASAMASLLFDDESWQALSARFVGRAREFGALGELPVALETRIFTHLFAGELGTASALLDELAAVTNAIGSRHTPYGALGLAAWQGREDEVERLRDDAMDDIVARGEGIGVTVSYWASALCLNGLGRYASARTAAERASAFEPERSASTRAWALVELVEAAARSGETEQAARALEQFSELAQASDTNWARGLQARSRALLADDGNAEALYQEAIERLGRTSVRLELARAHLLYGEWLRRHRRRIDARTHLQAASRIFADAGAEAFLERARGELLATGETLRRRTVETRDRLTPQEAQIARRARAGQTSAEIGAELFLSHRTVDWHLRSVIAKLGLGSRRAA